MPYIAIEKCPLPWFFGTSTLLGINSTVLPGNWWRIVQSNNIPQNPDGQKQYRLETIFEEVRLKYAPAAPSRMNCLFACATEDAANKFATSQSGRRDVWYKIEPIVAIEQVYLARWSLVDRNHLDEATTLRARKFAKRYWTEEDPAGPTEILLPSAVKITGRM